MAIDGASWALFSRRLKVPESGLGVDLVQVRILTTEELGDIRFAIRNLRILHESWGWMRFLRHRQELDAAVAEAHAVATASSGTYNGSHLDLAKEMGHALFAELESWAEAIRPLVDEPPPASDAPESLLDRARDVYSQGRLYEQIQSASSALGSVEAVSERRDDRIATSLVLQPNGIVLDTVAQRLHDELLPLAAAEILINRHTIEEAARLVLSLKAEVLYGLPCLLQPEALSSSPDGRVEVEDLPMGLVDGILNVVRMAEGIARQNSVAPEADSVGGANQEVSPQVRASASTQEPAELTETMDGDETGGEVQPPLESPSESSDVPAAPDGPLVSAIVDWRALVQEVTELVDETEEYWSAALKDALAAHQPLVTRISTLMAAILQQVELSSKDLVSQGLSPTIPAFPLPPRAAAEIAPTPTGQQRATQLSVAQVYAMRELTDALRPLQQPTVGNALGVGNGFWDSGAFARIRELAVAVAGVLFEPEGERDWHYFLHGLRWSLSNGMVEAAVTYACLAARSLGDIDYELLVGDDRIDFDAALETLRAVKHAYCSGEGAGVNVAWPLACFFRDVLAQVEFVQLAGHRRRRSGPVA